MASTTADGVVCMLAQMNVHTIHRNGTLGLSSEHKELTILVCRIAANPGSIFK